MKKSLLIPALALGIIAAPMLGGCVAIPAVLAANSIYQDGSATFQVTGGNLAKFPKEFRRAIQSAGGIVRQADAEYGLAVFSVEKVHVEYQAVEGAGQIRVTVANDSGVARSYDFKDTISLKASQIAQQLESAGYKISAVSRER